MGKESINTHWTPAMSVGLVVSVWSEVSTRGIQGMEGRREILVETEKGPFRFSFSTRTLFFSRLGSSRAVMSRQKRKVVER